MVGNEIGKLAADGELGLMSLMRQTRLRNGAEGKEPKVRGLTLFS